MPSKPKTPPRPVTPTRTAAGKSPGDVGNPQSGVPQGRSNEEMLRLQESERKGRPRSGKIRN